MAKLDLTLLSDIDGFVAGSLVDSGSGMMLGEHGSGVDLDVAAAGNTQVVRAKLSVMDALSLNDEIEDILISLGKQYHLIRISEKSKELFLYLVLDRGKANLAMARHQLRQFEKTLDI